MQNSSSKILAIAIFAFFVNLYMYHAVGSLGIFLFISALWALALTLFGGNTKEKKQQCGVLTLGLLILLPFLLFVGSPFRAFLATAGSILWILYAVYTFMRGNIPRGMLETVLAPLIVIGEYVRSALLILGGGGLTEKKSLEDAKSIRSPIAKSVIFGLLAGLPIVIILTSLLSSADPVFAKFIEKILSKEMLQQIPQRAIVTFFVIGLLMPSLVMKLTRPFNTPLRMFLQHDWRKELAVVLAMVAGVLALFLVVQWPYVFANVAKETSLVQFGVATYSEYVKKGFAELVMVTGIVYLLSWVTHLQFTHGEKGKTQRLILTLQSILALETSIFIASIIRRVILYTDYHGLSLARLYGLVLLFWLIGMGALLVLRFLTRQSYALYEKVWTAAIFIFAVTFNMQKMVVDKPPTVNGRTDYVYLSRLSTDGYPGWVKSYKWAKEIIERETRNAGIIDREGRREAHYALWIITNLNNHMDGLVATYGTEEELNILHIDKKYVVTGKFDRFLKWNARNYATYQKMREEIPQMELERLSKMASQLSDRIDKQPDGERDYDFDISMGSPVL